MYVLLQKNDFVLSKESRFYACFSQETGMVGDKSIFLLDTLRGYGINIIYLFKKGYIVIRTYRQSFKAKQKQETTHSRQSEYLEKRHHTNNAGHLEDHGHHHTEAGTYHKVHKHGIAIHVHHHHPEVNAKTIGYLFVSFAINILLSLVELIAGIIGGSVALIGDALHNTSDAFSILIAVCAYKIGRKKADMHFTFGFKRAEIIGGFVNLILLFISGIYLLVEGIGKLITPQAIDGSLIVWVSVLALFVDGVTARLSHRDAHHNGNMKMLFLHNLADALGSVGVIISGLCVMYFNWLFVDGVIALAIAAYMIFQSIVSFPKFVRILMNAAPDHISVEEVKKAILSIPHVQNVHHIHLWSVSENDVSVECHIVSDSPQAVADVRQVLHNRFEIMHCNIQTETRSDECGECCLSHK